MVICDIRIKEKEFIFDYEYNINMYYICSLLCFIQYSDSFLCKKCLDFLIFCLFSLSLHQIKLNLYDDETAFNS